MDNRRLLLAAFLCMALVVVWSIFFPPEPPPVPPSGEEAPPAEAPEGPGGPAPSPGQPSGPARPAPGLTAAGLPGELARPIAAASPQDITLSHGTTRAVFTNRGAQLISLKVGGARDQSVELVRRRREDPWPFGLTTGDRGSHALNGALFAAERGAGGRSVTFRYNGPLGAAEKTFSFTPDGLIEVKVTVPGHRGWGVLLGPGIRNDAPDDLKVPFQRAQRGAVYWADKVRILPADTDDLKALAGPALRWIALEDTYFLNAAIPGEGLDRAVVEPVLLDVTAGGEGARFVPLPRDLSSAQKDMARDLRLVLKPRGDSLSVLTFWGAKEYDRLAELPYDLEQTVRLGMFGFLARALLVGLQWIYDAVVANYGWAIVLMTVLIRLLLLPLTHMSMKSMKKMQDLNPKMQAIREKYRTKLKDKQGRPNIEMQQRQNQEIMVLYKEHGVNPAGGCLPMVLQLPILFAFYSLLSTAIELRGAPWILWIQDLSARDPHYVLPILMGATQFLQVKLAPQAGDPMQRRLFLMMPIVFTFLFLPSPSGLVLYWLTNNVLTIVQQGVYNRLQGRTAGGAKTAHQRG